MNDLIAAATSWYALPFGVLIAGITFGLMPGLMLRVIVRIYPKESPRRDELVAELYTLGYVKRVIWVFQQLETSLTEGGPARLRSIRDKRHQASEELSDTADAVAGGNEGAESQLPAEAALVGTELREAPDFLEDSPSVSYHGSHLMDTPRLPGTSRTDQVHQVQGWVAETATAAGERARKRHRGRRGRGRGRGTGTPKTA